MHPQTWTNNKISFFNNFIIMYAAQVKQTYKEMKPSDSVETQG